MCRSELVFCYCPYCGGPGKFGRPWALDRMALCEQEPCVCVRNGGTGRVPNVVVRDYHVCSLCAFMHWHKYKEVATWRDRIYDAIQTSPYIPEGWTIGGQARKRLRAAEKDLRGHIQWRREQGFEGPGPWPEEEIPDEVGGWTLLLRWFRGKIGFSS